MQDATYSVPQAGTSDDLQALYTTEYAGLYGWLLASGFNPRVIDAGTTAAIDPTTTRLAITLLPQMVAPATAAKLVAFHHAGGVLVSMLDRGTHSTDGNDSNPDVAALRALFPAEPDGSWSWPGTPLGVRHGSANAAFAGGGTVETYWYQTYWKPLGGAKLSPLLVERNALFGGNGRTIAFATTDGAAPRALVGAHLASAFNQHDYYGVANAELTRTGALARALARLANLTPTLRADSPRDQVWARRGKAADAPLFLFVTHDAVGATAHLRIGALSPLGLAPAARYNLTEALGGATLGQRSGAELLANGIELPMAEFGTAVVVVTPAR